MVLLMSSPRCARALPQRERFARASSALPRGGGRARAARWRAARSARHVEPHLRSPWTASIAFFELNRLAGDDERRHRLLEVVLLYERCDDLARAAPSALARKKLRVADVVCRCGSPQFRTLLALYDARTRRRRPAVRLLTGAPARSHARTCRGRPRSSSYAALRPRLIFLLSLPITSSSRPR